jgi:hypothetical protein
MNQIDAIYQNGVFKPRGDPGLREPPALLAWHSLLPFLPVRSLTA